MHIRSTAHPHKKQKERGGFKRDEQLAESPPFTAWKPLCGVMLPVPLWNLPEETDTGLGNGVAMATKRSTRDVKAQSGRGGAERGREREKSLQDHSWAASPRNEGKAKCQGAGFTGSQYPQAAGLRNAEKQCLQEARALSPAAPKNKRRQMETGGNEVGFFGSSTS
ncbi:hypothetical protein H920_00399 [Fukomys damarensis]|uniref:Uncharacterized protein n=1 Tax=Fukomys damarensis TaxID=885580 RepID=A0A091E654_FUKDA|nr:hypothetical protein H920_00399 [Fukomys damarensis]